ncbi:MAG: hypothetical protein AAB341_05470 [Planctomycetota bacterium]
MSIEWLLWVAFSRWSIKQCFEQAKNKLGLDHFEVRGQRAIFKSQISKCVKPLAPGCRPGACRPSPDASCIRPPRNGSPTINIATNKPAPLTLGPRANAFAIRASNSINCPRAFRMIHDYVVL